MTDAPHPLQPGSAQPGQHLIERLRHPAQDCTQLPFWFWNGDLNPETMRRQIREMCAQGVMGACPHPRFGMDRRQYLEPAYWAAMDATVDEAAKNAASILLYDEYNWPSGAAGGRVTDGRPDLHPHGLDWVVRAAVGPGPVVIRDFAAGEPASGRFERIVAAFLVEADCPIADAVEERDAPPPPWGTIAADGQSVGGGLPEGPQRILVFFQAVTSSPSPLDPGSNAFVDYLNPEVGRRFLELTHERYRSRYADHFGTTIVGIFTDEPSTISAGPFPWTRALAVEFRHRRGYDLLPHLPALCDDRHPQGWRHRAAYWQTVAELFDASFLAPLATWCRNAGIALTGHIYEEYLRAWPAAPHLMDWLRRFDWPGVDALGPRAAAAGIKIPASVAHLEGNRRFVCEALGLADGWNATHGMARRGLQYLAVMGVDTFVPHAFHQTVDDAQNECPPSFFAPAPQWRHYHRLAALTARLSAFNRSGSHVAPVAVLYPIVSLWADGTGGRGQGGKPWEVLSNGNGFARRTIEVFDAVVATLAAGPWDCDVVDARALAGARIANARLEIGPERFSCLVLPAIRTIEVAAAHSIIAFLAGGGRVALLGDSPLRCFPDDGGATAHRLSTALAAAASTQVVRLHAVDALVPWLETNMPAVATLDFPAGRPSDVLVMARQEAGSLLWLFVNDATSPRDVVARLPVALNTPIIFLDAAGGEPTSCLPRNDGTGMVIDLHFDALAALIVVAGHGLPPAVLAPVPWRPQVRVPLAAWTIHLAPAVGEEPTWSPLPVWRMRERDWEAVPGWEKNGYDDSAWQRVTAHDGRAHGRATTASVLLRTTLPPGARALRLPLPVTGEYLLHVNGVLIERRLGPPPAPGILDLAPFVTGLGDHIAIEVAAMSGLSGLNAPVDVLCAPFVLPALASWMDLGFGWYSGCVRYRAEVDVASVPQGAWLDLGAVEHGAEVQVNGRLAGILPWAPYRVDLTGLLVAGRNDLVVEVVNTLANRFAWDDAHPTRTGSSWGCPPRPDPSGLLGPVVLEMTP